MSGVQLADSGKMQHAAEGRDVAEGRADEDSKRAQALSPHEMSAGLPQSRQGYVPTQLQLRHMMQSRATSLCLMLQTTMAPQPVQMHRWELPCSKLQKLDPVVRCACLAAQPASMLLHAA